MFENGINEAATETTGGDMIEIDFRWCYIDEILHNERESHFLLNNSLYWSLYQQVQFYRNPRYPQLNKVVDRFYNFTINNSPEWCF
jgi:hypothetical protein